MTTILEKSPYDPDFALRRAEVKENGENAVKYLPRPPLPVLKEGWIAASHDPSIRLAVKVLLDTGCDITIVNPVIIDKLDTALKKKIADPSYLYPTRQIKFYNDAATPTEEFQKAYEVSISLSVDSRYSSQYGFIAPDNWNFEDIDVWLGQDIFEQLIVTFDGVAQTITIVDPAGD